MDGRSNPKPRKLPPRCRHAHSFEPFFGILPHNPRFFFHHLVPHVCPRIENSKVSLWNPRYSEKGNFPEHFASIFSLLMPISHESKHIKLMTSLIVNLLLAVFYQQSLSCEVIDKSQGDLNSSNSKYFPLCPPQSISITLLFWLLFHLTNKL